MLLQPPEGPLVLGIALVDFNHLVSPKIEFCHGDIFQDEDIVKILPFLALSDGAHLSLEDYSYFHLVPNAPIPTTIFGISFDRQIPASVLLVKDVDVTRSIIQKAVMVLASKPVFGPTRGVGTRILFEQHILDEDHRPLLTDREVLRNLQDICKDVDKTLITAKVSRTAIPKTNAACLRLLDDALFVVSLDDAAPDRDECLLRRAMDD
ncbi:hypothetical protein P692DRAFT_20875513 [Suillus brevipes Sb2]|nr:hypothetical protein P692DRAFT_20875513 [Suillus brevipes Sb2]